MLQAFDAQTQSLTHFHCLGTSNHCGCLYAGCNHPSRGSVGVWQHGARIIWGYSDMPTFSHPQLSLSDLITGDTAHLYPKPVLHGRRACLSVVGTRLHMSAVL